jgi:hypothetical protein
VTGGLILPTAGSAGTVGELDIRDALIAYYGDRAQAVRLEPDVARNMKPIGATVARDGAENVAWLAPPSAALRHTVAVCTAG